jgi:hypothetical protein
VIAPQDHTRKFDTNEQIANFNADRGMSNGGETLRKRPGVPHWSGPNSMNVTKSD